VQNVHKYTHAHTHAHTHTHRHSVAELQELLSHALALFPEAASFIADAQARRATQCVARVHELGPIVLLDVRKEVEVDVLILTNLWSWFCCLTSAAHLCTSWGLCCCCCCCWRLEIVADLDVRILTGIEAGCAVCGVRA
jgi:hypothetical protein